MQQSANKTQKFGYWPEVAVALAVAAGLFAFFLLLYPYHLRHREQTMLFLSNWDWISEQYLTLKKGGLVNLCGDWLQQWFYYLGVGPVIVTMLLVLTGVVWHQITRLALRLTLRRYSPSRIDRTIAVVVALVVTLWEAGRECLPEYPVASTLQVLGWSSLVLLLFKTRLWMRRVTIGIFGMMLGCWMLDLSPLPHTKAWGKPNMQLERLMALDVEASFGKWNRLQQLSQEGKSDYNLEIYYRNLGLARRGHLADSLMMFPQNGTDGLFIPVNEEGNYFLFGAAGEAWWAVGDMTMAEHATLLSLIFSPRHTGSRALRRLAEINQAKGDTLATRKYLRLLNQSAVHQLWAQKLSEHKISSAPMIGDALPKDTLRLQGEVQLCLRGLLDANQGNETARQYLLCYDLLAQDFLSFADDVLSYGCPSGVRLYEEAMLVIMSSRPEMREAMQPLVREATYQDFLTFNHAYAQSNGYIAPLKQRFGKSLWYYLKAQEQKKHTAE